MLNYSGLSQKLNELYFRKLILTRKTPKWKGVKNTEFLRRKTTEQEKKKRRMFLRGLVAVFFFLVVSCPVREIGVAIHFRVEFDSFEKNHERSSYLGWQGATSQWGMKSSQTEWTNVNSSSENKNINEWRGFICTPQKSKKNTKKKKN